MSTDEKYKDLKRRYATLKHAVKQFHDEFERTKAELEAKRHICSELEEQHQQLKTAYDELIADVSVIKSRKPAKPSSSTWENALTLIKKGAQSVSNDTDGDTSLLYNEVVSLKNQLEAAAHEKEELLKRNQALRNDHDKQAFEYNSTVTELKERILALEGILKDLQGNLISSEYRATRASSEIANLNSSLAARDKQVEKLEETLASERRKHVRHTIAFEQNLRTKLLFDLSRIPLINTLNIYNHRYMHDWSLLRHSVSDIRSTLHEALLAMLKAWSATMRFIKCPQIVTESVLQRSPTMLSTSSNQPDDETSSMTPVSNCIDNASGDCNGKTWDTKAHVDAAADGTMADVDTVSAHDDGSLPSCLGNSDSDGHIWLSLESYRKTSESILNKLERELSAVEGANIGNVSLFRRLAQTFRNLSHNQRIYLCIEEYVCPYTDDKVMSMRPRQDMRSARIFIRCLGDMCMAVSKLFTFYEYALLSLDQLVENDLCRLATVLSSEVTFGNSNRYDNPETPLESDNDFNEETSYTRPIPVLGHNDVPYVGNFTPSVSVVPKSRMGLLDMTEDHSSSRVLRSLSRQILASVKDILAVISVFKSVVSHRLCYPKLASGYFLPLSGGSAEMVDLSSSIVTLETQLSSITEDIILLMLGIYLQSRREWLCGLSIPVSTTPGVVDPSVDYEFQNMLSNHVREINTMLLQSPERVHLETVSASLRSAGEGRREILACNERLREINEELMAERARCEALESQLLDSRRVPHPDDRLVSEFERLLSRYRFYDSRGGYNVDAAAQSTYHDLMDEIHLLREDGSKKVKRLSVYIRHLVKSVELLEDSNRQLRQGLKDYAEQYEESRSSADAMALNYKEQLGLMSEHISELNIAMVKAEYRTSELLEMQLLCPACKSISVLRDVVSAKSGGGCTTCARRLLKKPS
ncbi:uncharacterized protein BBOV_IV004530 [Babesia bovis T2Bo]|uniref:uncharacterized protein n=1 Tax=Babesia bovis T2Bo TaxID=484906 RepID=UPI001D96C8DB|nr:uncharacterized protein BBOV_IV004530 [Babesia bovis T2Bo]EDO06814.2 hypothetical protein BBOV_IV004530 [Babesia bovis T2Bo]